MGHVTICADNYGKLLEAGGKFLKNSLTDELYNRLVLILYYCFF